MSSITGVRYKTTINTGSSDGVVTNVVYTPGTSTLGFTGSGGGFNGDVDLSSLVSDGSETAITAGTGTNITGSGTAGDPYVVTSTVSGADNWGTQVVISDATLGGDGTVGNPLSVVFPADANDIDYVNGVTYTPGTSTLTFTGVGNAFAGDIDLSALVSDGSETSITAGGGINVTGAGTSGDPYVVTNSAPDSNDFISNVTWTAGTNTLAFTGSGGAFNSNIDLSSLISDGSETTITAGSGTTVSGSGTSGDPYVINSTVTGADGAITNVVYTPGTQTLAFTGINGAFNSDIDLSSLVSDGSETSINAGTNISITGTGTAGDPYVVNCTQAGADDWGTQVVVSDGSLTGDGTSGNPLAVVSTADYWQVGLEVTCPNEDQTIDYAAGSYVINGVSKSIATGGTLDFQALGQYSGMTNDQHRLAIVYVDADETVKAMAGPIAEKEDPMDLPMMPADSVCLAVVELRVDSGGTPRYIKCKYHVNDCRQGGIPVLATDQFVRVSPNDEETGYLSSKLSNTGGVQFSIVTGASESMKADIDATNVTNFDTEVSNNTSVTANTAKVSFPEAPNDGNQYARKNLGWEQVASSDATSVSEDVTQGSHGLAAGDVVRHNGTSFVKAQADAEGNSQAIGIVSAVADANNFTVIYAGKITGLSGLTAGEVHYLSAATAGALTTTEPGISKPILSAVSATEGLVVIERGLTGGVNATTTRIGHTWAVCGEVKVASGDTDFILPFFVDLAPSQTAKVVKARYVINSGTSATVKVQVNGSDATGFTGLTATTTPTSIDPSDITLNAEDKIALVVTGVSGTPTHLSFTLFIDYTA